MQMRYRTTGLDGLLIVDKPLQLSSMDVVRRVRKAAGHAKTGHAGTLDPLATGVVICCLGKATKIVNGLMGQPKIYETDVDLSAFTNTDDLEGEREEVPVEADQRPTLEAIVEASKQLTGTIQQQPSAFSAIHINGERAYKRARRGEDVEMPTREVVVHSLEVLSYDWPIVTLRVNCGKGTYIRSIARDLGKLLNTGGHCATLRRTAVGKYTVDEAWTIEQIEQGIAAEDLLPIPLFIDQDQS